MRTVSAMDRLKTNLVPGQTYRRADLLSLSASVDRSLAKLVAQGHLKKLSGGLYLAPKTTAFGDALPDEQALLKSFLNDDHFVVYSPNQFNALELGTTQLYNQRVVFNRKRVGEFNLGGRKYTFHRWREAPKQLTQEFLVVLLLNSLSNLAEDREQVVTRLSEKLSSFNQRKLKFAATHYGTLSTQKRLGEMLQASSHDG